jgi:hypothetical protein
MDADRLDVDLRAFEQHHVLRCCERGLHPVVELLRGTAALLVPMRSLGDALDRSQPCVPPCGCGGHRPPYKGIPPI